MEEADIFEYCLTKWKEFQLFMIFEESNELFVELASLQKFIAKILRANPYSPIFCIDAVKHELKSYHGDRLAEEFADTILMFTQFNPEFKNNVLKAYNYKLNKLRTKILEESK